MSLDLLASGDTIVPQTEVATTGEAFGMEYSYTDGTALDCLVQEASDSESVRQGTRGQRGVLEIFFTSDPSLNQGKRIKWTHRGGVALATPIYLRVLTQSWEGRPGEPPMLWIVRAEEDTTRQEA